MANDGIKEPLTVTLKALAKIAKGEPDADLIARAALDSLDFDYRAGRMRVIREKPNFFLYTDGGCHPNPGFGGWAAIVVDDTGKEVELHGGEKEATNNRMEMMAVIRGLEALGTSPVIVTVTTDSKYVKDGTSMWVHGWKRRGWKTADGKPVKNQDLWLELDRLAQFHEVTWKWVKGHNGHHYNERCDALATLGKREAKAS